MVIALTSGSARSVFEPWPGHCVVFLGKTLYDLTVPLFTQVYKWVPANLMLGVTMRWTSIPSRGSRNTPSRFMQLKEIRAGGPEGPLGSYADFTYLPAILRTCFSGLRNNLPSVSMLPSWVVQRCPSLALAKAHTNVPIAVNVMCGTCKEPLQKLSRLADI